MTLSCRHLSYVLFCFPTQGSRFYENELKKEKQVNQRIETMMQQKAQITSQQLRKAQLQVLIYLVNKVEAGIIVVDGLNALWSCYQQKEDKI